MYFSGTTWYIWPPSCPPRDDAVHDSISYRVGGSCSSLGRSRSWSELGSTFEEILDEARFDGYTVFVLRLWASCFEL